MKQQLHRLQQTAQPKRMLARGMGLLVGLLCVNAAPVVAQRLQDFNYTDSLTAALQQQGRWPALDSVGRATLHLGTDYPALRRRLGRAAAERGRPATAIQHYAVALRADPLDTAARAGLALAYLALGQRDEARLLAAGLGDSLRQTLHLQPRCAVSLLEIEASGQTTNTIHRLNAGFGRIGVGSQLSARVGLLQSVSYFQQDVRGPRIPPRRPGDRPPIPPFITIHQWEYHGLLGIQLAERWRAKLGYHYLNSYYGDEHYPSHVFYGALSYTRPYYVAQVGAYTGPVTDTVRTQLDARLTVYPLGNLRLYGFGRGSLIRSAGRTYPNALLGAGVRIRPWLWAEAFGSTGLVPVLAEADGTYVFNLFDRLQQRGGASVHILLPHSLALRLHYIAEQRVDRWSLASYNLYSLTTSLAWTW